MRAIHPSDGTHSGGPPQCGRLPLKRRGKTRKWTSPIGHVRRRKSESGRLALDGRVRQRKHRDVSRPWTGAAQNRETKPAARRRRRRRLRLAWRSRNGAGSSSPGSVDSERPSSSPLRTVAVRKSTHPHAPLRCSWRWWREFGSASRALRPCALRLAVCAKSPSLPRSQQLVFYFR